MVLPFARRKPLLLGSCLTFPKIVILLVSRGSPVVNLVSGYVPLVYVLLLGNGKVLAVGGVWMVLLPEQNWPLVQSESMLQISEW